MFVRRQRLNRIPWCSHALSWHLHCRANESVSGAESPASGYQATLRYPGMEDSAVETLEMSRLSGRRAGRPLMRSPRCRALNDCATRQGNTQEAQQEHTCGCSNGQNIVKVRPATPIKSFVAFRCEPTVPRPNIAMIHQAPKPLQDRRKQHLCPTTAARVSGPQSQENSKQGSPYSGEIRLTHQDTKAHEPGSRA
jgi:hypothetical protein